MAKTAAQRYIGKVGKLAKKIREEAGYTIKEIKHKIYNLTPQEAVKKAAKQLKYEDGDRHRHHSVAVDGIAGHKGKAKGNSSKGKSTKGSSSKGKKSTKK